MNYIATLAFTFVTAVAADADAQFATVSLAKDARTLEYQVANGRTSQAPMVKGQVEFASPKIGPAGAAIGWLAEFPGSNTSYPIPLQLVVMDQNNRIHTFSGPQAIFSWCFSEGSSAVTFRQAALHGPTAQVFEMRRITDGKLLKRFALPWQGPDAEPSDAKVLKWARCALDE